MRIKSLTARQIINGKGHPTLEVEVSSSRFSAKSSIPLAATKSRYEFYDEYDNDVRKFHDETLNSIVDHIERVVAPELVGKNSMDQQEIDRLILDIDNTLDRSSLGVNTLTAISQAVVKLGAKESDLPLFKYIRVLHDFVGDPFIKLNSEYKLPNPVITAYQSAGHNKERKLPAQEILLLPKANFVYSRDLIDMFSALSHLKLETTNENMDSFLKMTYLHLLDVDFKFVLGVDMAASRYKRNETNTYVIPNLHSEKMNFNGNTEKLKSIYKQWIAEYGLQFVEDLYDEDDYSAWKSLREDMVVTNQKLQIVADDLTATNIERLDKVGNLECCNNVVIKPTQIGTVSECIFFAQRARKYSHNLTVSYRFGETEDSFISDLAVGLNAEYLRSGYFLGSEYNAKLNRLLQIENSIG